MIRLIASDLDGTLLNQFGRVSEHTAQVVKAAQEQGVRFVVCTGREYQSAAFIIQSSGIVCDYICNSGATWVGPQGNVVHDSVMQPELVRKSWEIIAEEEVTAQVVIDNGSAVSMTREQTENYLKEELFPALSKLSGMDYSQDLDRFLAGYRTDFPMERIFSGAVPAYKVMAASMDLEKLARIRRRLAEYPLSVVSTSPVNLEISGLDARKGIAVQAYAQSLGINADEIMVLGDSENDINMFEVPFAQRVAMENADQMIKDRATYITRTNREDGAAYAIEQFVLNPLS